MILANIFNPEVLVIVLVIMLVMFGGKKIPELMRGVGQGMGHLKKGMEEGKSQLNDIVKTDP